MIRHRRITLGGLSLGLALSFALAGAHQLVADEPTYNELRQQFESAYAARDYQKALDASIKLHEARPKIVAHVYNVACMNCLLGNKDDAYTWLDKLCDTDFDDADYLADDADFRTMRAEPRFREILEKIRSRKAKPDKPADRKIRKLDEDKPKIADKALSPAELDQKINDLTREMMSISQNDRKKGLELAMSAHEHALALAEAAKAPDASDRLKARSEMRLGQTMYNVACMYSLLNRKDDAFDYLNKSLDHATFEADMLGQIKGDSDLNNLRSDARYAKVLERLGEKTTPPDPRFSDDKLPPVEKMTPAEHHQKVFEVAQQLVEMVDNKDYAAKIALARQGLAHAKTLMDLDSNNTQIQHAWSLANYNVACMYSLNRDTDAALFYLDRAIDAGGFFNRPIATSIENDNDFDNIRSDDRFKALMEKAKRARPVARPDSSAAPAPAQANREKTVDPQWKITLPKNHDASKPAPLVVALHHYHGNMNVTTDRWRKAADDVGAILLTPQGTVDMGEGMYHWGQDINTIERNVMKAIDKVMDEYKVDSRRVVLVGFSQGGWATWAIAARNPDTFRGVIPVCGAVRPEIEENLESGDVGRLRVWIMLGEDENSRVVESNERAAKLLKKAGAQVRLETYEGVGHGYPQDSDKELTKALHFILD
ncbi:MAG TPA: prolyl oligopeptidase family serine peptidase [Phycisphaerae bacterium]|nr:prolyl oligopeptidase family serine peptidase [Phycisphaerae bacterium]HRW51393.1 prolyl oligopeptidase family serine peptidase [Phycisphaerae bacterium]